MRALSRSVLALVALAALPTAPAAAQDEPPRVRVEEPRVGPAYPMAFVARILRRHRRELLRCAEHAYARRGAVPSPTAIRFTITDEGKAEALRVEGGGPEAAEAREAFRRCLRARKSRWRFPRPPGGAKLHVRVPLLEALGR